MKYLLEISAVQPYSPALIVLLVIGTVGFIAAVTIGSIALYNSKKPQGWQDQENPDFIPKIDK